MAEQKTLFWDIIPQYEQDKKITKLLISLFFCSVLASGLTFRGIIMKKSFVKTLAFGLVSTLILSACGAETSSSSEASSSSQTKKTEASSEVVSSASVYEYTNPTELQETYDIVIVGAGGAGMAAALSAKDAGMNPVIFEKAPVAGGNTMKSSGGMNASKTKFQEELGIEDSNELFFEDTLTGGKGTNNQEL